MPGPSTPAQPLKVAPVTPSKPNSSTPTPTQAKSDTRQPSAPANPAEISSPHELTAFVEKLLEQLDAKFDDMSSQILDRMSQMSTRVDALEASIQDIINGDTAPVPSVPQSPAPSTAGGSVSGVRRNGSGP